MTLPIIILLERHWDVNAKKSLQRAMPMLREKGYDTLCFENGPDATEESIIQETDDTIKFIEERLHETRELFNRRKQILPDFSEMDFLTLDNFLYDYVSSKHSAELAKWFKELPGYKEKQILLQNAQSLGFQFNGVDIPEVQLARLKCAETQSNLRKTVQEVYKLDSARTEAFRKNLFNLQAAGRGIVFVLGQFHHKPLLHAFRKDFMEKEVIFIHPYTSSSLSSTYPDTHRYMDQGDPSLLDCPVNSTKDIEAFFNRLKAVVDGKLAEFYSPMKNNTQANILEKNTSLKWQCFNRKSDYVDCVASFDNRGEADSLITHLKTQGLNGYYSFFHNKSSVFISCVNSKDVGLNIKMSG